MVLTSEFMSGRILGVSKTATVGTRVLFLSSGNNVGPVKDMTRRCISIRLDPGCETPAARSFRRPDLVREVLRERGCYVSAALTIVRAWIVAGRPMTTCKSLAGYGDWSDLCRQPLLWLGCTDPTASVFEAMTEDPDRETLRRLLTAWQTTFGKTPAMVRDAVKQTAVSQKKHQELGEVLRDIAEERGEINRRKLGWWIKKTCWPHRRWPAFRPRQRANRSLRLGRWMWSNRFCRFYRFPLHRTRKLSTRRKDQGRPRPRSRPSTFTVWISHEKTSSQSPPG